MAAGVLGRMDDAAGMEVDQSEEVGDSADPQQLETPKKKRKSPAVPWKKPKDMPKRPLSAYNLFFQSERRRLLESGAEGARDDSSHSMSQDGSELAVTGDLDSPREGAKSGKLSFSNLAKTVATKWKTLDVSERAEFEARAAVDKQRYDIAVAEWRAKNKKAKEVPVEDSKPSADLLTAASSAPTISLPPTLVERDNIQLFEDDWSMHDSPVVRQDAFHTLPPSSHAVEGEFGHASSRTANVDDRYNQFSSSSLWASHASLDPNDLSSSTTTSGHGSSAESYPWEHTSTTVGSSTFELTAFSPMAPHVRRLPMETEGERIGNLGIPSIGEHEVSSDQVRLHRSASLPPSPLGRMPATLPPLSVYARSHSTGMRHIGAYHPHETIHLDPSLLAQRSASFSGALPPPPFRLPSVPGYFDVGQHQRRRHSVGTQFPGYPMTSQLHPFQEPMGEVQPLSLAAATGAAQRDAGVIDVNTLRRTLDSDMLDLLTDTFPDWGESNPHPNPNPNNNSS